MQWSRVRISSDPLKYKENMKKTITIDKHVLLPKVTKLSDKEKEDLFSKYSITIKELPKILRNDPTLCNIDPKAGDIIKIIRVSQTAGESIFYRGVINE